MATTARRSASFTGRGRKRKTLAMLKMAVFAPMPKARVRIAMAVKAGDFKSMRMLKRMSCQSVCIGYSFGACALRVDSGLGTDAGLRYELGGIFVSGDF